jgi:conjugal transfer pilus assembly protein TraF
VKKISLLKIFLFNALLFTRSTQAYFYESHAEGWHWYNNIIEDANKESKMNTTDPIEQMKVLKNTVERALDMAILDPTEVNVKNYIELQNRVSNQASIFANIWQKVLYKNPQLNYALIHPTNTIARQIDLDLQHKKEDVAIAKLAQESGLFFFYSSSCIYCRKFAPILKEFASTYKIVVIPITMDGVIFPEFPETKKDRGHAAKFNVTIMPSLFAVNPYTQKAYPISQGLISQADLRKRILDITRDFKSEI